MPFILRVLNMMMKKLCAGEQGGNSRKLEEELGKTRKPLLVLGKFLLWFNG